MTDQELKDLVASLAVAQAKTEIELAKLAKGQAEVIAQTQAEIQETSRVVSEVSRRMDTMASNAETQAAFKETDRFLKEIGQRMGSMASNQGDVAEEFFYNSLKAAPQVGGIVFDTVTPNLVIGTKQSSSEFDIVLVNGQSVALIEVKYKAHVNDLDQIQKQVDRYRQLRPEHKNYKIFGGIAGFKVPADVVKLAQERGMFVLQRRGDVIDSAIEEMRAF
jgi:hypothetical protein